jgi:hypothetical protein
VPADVIRSNAIPLFVRMAKVFGGLPRSSWRMDHKDVDTRRPLTKTVISSVKLESRFYAVLTKAA